jgi:RNA polymerase sigma-70 factor (ECF subfamily)
VEGRPLDDRLQAQQALVREAKGGSVDAYRELVRAHEEVAFRVAILITGNAADADDAASEAMVKAFYALDRFRADDPFRPWLLRIVANEARNRRRSSGRRARLAERLAGGAGSGRPGGRAGLPSSGASGASGASGVSGALGASGASGEAAPSAEDTVIAALEHRALFDAVGALGERDREVVALRFFAELSEAETAAVLGCALGTAKSRLHRALARLRQALPAEAFDV